MCEDVTSAVGRPCLNWIETEPQGDLSGSKCEKQDSKSRVDQMLATLLVGLPSPVCV